MFAAETITEVKQRTNLVEIVGEVVTLKRQGGRFVGCCPFHQEKTPSLYVTEQRYHCFGCGEGGDAISFLMKTRGLSFADALRELGTKVGVEISDVRFHKPDPNAALKPKLLAINTLAAEYFSRMLREAPPEVTKYLASRGLSQRTIEAFQIGFAPNEGDSLVHYLRGQGVSDELIIRSGLGKRNAGGSLYDTFRARIQFPIQLDNVKIAGFGGRIVPSLFPPGRDLPPKYLNSAENALYHKSTILYGLPQALGAVRESGELLLVEGYMDVVSLSQVGVRNVAASCGTALGERHLRRVAELCKRAVLLFDGDAAGRTAAARSFKMCLRVPIDVWAVFLPEGEDPDSIARRFGEQTNEYLSSLARVALIDVYVDSLIEEYRGNLVEAPGASAKARIAREVVELLEQIDDDIYRNELLSRAAFRLRLDPAQLQAKGSRPAQPILAKRTNEESAGPSTHREVAGFDRVTQELLSCLMVLKEELPLEVLNTPDLCHELDPDLLSFCQGLAEIMTDKELAELGRREAIRDLLRSFGESWVLHWKKSYEMAKSRDVSMRRHFDRCYRTIRQGPLRRQVEEIDLLIRFEALGEDERGRLCQQKIDLLRQIKELAR